MPTGPAPAAYFSGIARTADGVELSFGSAAGPFLLVLGPAAIATFAFVQHSFAPCWFALVLPLFLLKSVWTFCYSGPHVLYQLRLFTFTFWHREWPLDRSDSASADLIEDSWYNMRRPEWYKLNLWSCARQRDYVIMRSNDRDDLQRLVALLNDTIKEVCGKAAS